MLYCSDFVMVIADFISVFIVLTLGYETYRIYYDAMYHIASKYNSNEIHIRTMI